MSALLKHMSDENIITQVMVYEVIFTVFYVFFFKSSKDYNIILNLYDFKNQSQPLVRGKRDKKYN